MSLPMVSLSRDGWVNPLPERFQRSQLQRVSYHLDEDKLIRYSWQMMDRYDDEDPQQIVLLDNVRSFKLRALMHSTTAIPGASNADKSVWQDSWPPEGSPAANAGIPSSLPIAVEILIDIDGWGEVKRVFELVNDGR